MEPTLENFRLRVFRSVARHLNLRQAAEELLLTQPAVTQQIKALESELGTALFDRAGGRVLLNPAGHALLPFAGRIAQLASEAREAVAAASGTHAGHLAIGASQTIGQYLLPSLIAGFLRQHPQVQLSILGGNTNSVLAALAAREIQVALIEGPAMRRDLRVEPFLQDHMVCVAPTSHPWAGQEIPLEDLAHATLVTREQGSGSRRIVEAAFEKAGLHLKDLHLGLSFDANEAVLSAVEAGLGLAFISRWAVRNQLALGTLRIVHIRSLDLARMFSIAIPAGPDPTGLTGLFHRFVRENAEDLAPRPTGRPATRPVKSK
jgi:DNA-binding transcriptional LysR family regulator